MNLLKEAVPSLSRAAVLWNSSNPLHPRMLQDIEKAARRLNVRVIPVEWKDPGEIEKAFHLARRERVGGVLALPDPETWRAREQIAGFALEHRLPTAGIEPGFAAAGNLVQYGPDLSESCHCAAFYVDKILKGAKPADLPVEQPTRFSLVMPSAARDVRVAGAGGRRRPDVVRQRRERSFPASGRLSRPHLQGHQARDLPVEQPTTFELVINLRTAKALGLAIPPTLLLRADRVIE